MVDRKTGAITFQEPAWTITRSMTLSDLLASPLAAHLQKTERPPYCNCALKNLGSGQERFNIELTFQKGKLRSVMLVDDQPPFSWEHQSDATELERQARHERWLTASLGKKRKFPWGEVLVIYDRRAGFSRIEIEYASPLERLRRNPFVLAIGVMLFALAVSMFFLALVLFRCGYMFGN